MIAYRDLSPEIPLVVSAKPRDVYCDGIAVVEKIDPNCRITYFIWDKLPGSGIIVRMPNIRITRPLASLVGTAGGFGLGSGILNAMSLSFKLH